MVTIQPQTISKDKTVKQIVLTNNLLQSRYFSKAEFQKYKTLELKNIKTSYEAGLLIALLIAKLRFRKKFSSKRSRAHLKCDFCSSRENLTRLYSPQFESQIVRCEKCLQKKADSDKELADLEEANSERLQEELMCARCEEAPADQSNLCGSCLDEIHHM